MPNFPVQGLDAAWSYALNEAVAHRMVFGRDVVFTLGPYASAYTWMYHPGTDHLMLVADTLIGLAVAMGALSLVTKDRLAYLLPLPLAMCLVGRNASSPFYGRDALFLILPLLFLMVCVRVTLPATHRWKLIENGQVVVSLAIMMLALSLIPFVKGTFAAMSASIGGLGWFLLLRARLRLALALGGLFVAGLAGFWLAAHQPLWALSGFFLAQVPIISGYNDAMSAMGVPAEMILYGISASLILLAGGLSFARGAGLPGKIMCIGLALPLFLVFKAAFIRFQTIIAADFVLLAAFLLATSLPRWGAVIIIATNIAVWLPTAQHYDNLIVSLEKSPFGQLFEGVRVRLGLGQGLRQEFETARAKIRQDNPLPRIDGSADIYPFDQDILLASGLKWSPRPIMQSYSAYEPELANINANHLLGSFAPRHIFFDVCSIDNRLATLEDGKTWPFLLTRYHVVDRAGRFLILDRNQEIGNGPNTQNISVSRQRIGRQFNVPDMDELVWAEIDVKPTFLGQIFAVLFRPPQLRMLFRYKDGHTEGFRYLAAAGRSGFIISPVIHDTCDFAALLTKGREQYLSGMRPTSVEITGDPGTHLFWKGTFEVQLRRIEVPVQVGAEKFVYDQVVNDSWLSDLTVNRKIVGSGECAIDAINRKPVTAQPVELKGRLLVQGWAVFSAQRGVAGDEIFVTLAGDDDNPIRAVRARIFPRPDVNAYFKHPEMGPVGFEASLDPTALKGMSKLEIYVKLRDQFVSCPWVVKISD
jgi:hypothetical protein